MGSPTVRCLKPRCRNVSACDWFVLVHHPLAAETGLTATRRESLRSSESRALTAARRVIVTSQLTAAALAAYGVSSERIAIIEPGTDQAALASGSGTSTVELLCVASLVPRKGHDLLIEALASLTDRKWYLTCVGGTDHDPDTTARLTNLVQENGLEDRIHFAGALSSNAVDTEYARADVFVYPSRHEGYGMAVAEALARGIPVLATGTGAADSLVGHTAGIIVPTNDGIALRHALATLLDDQSLRAALAAGARDARRRLPRWPAACARFDHVLRTVTNDPL